MSKKRGGTHVGFVLSFVIFVTFLIFLYSALIGPITNQENKQSILENLKMKLIEKLSIGDFTTKSLTILINPEDLGDKECIRINENEGIKDGGLVDLVYQGINLTIKDSLNRIINYSEQGPNNLNLGPLNSSFDGSLNIYYASGLGGSPEFTGSSDCFVIRVEDYKIDYEKTGGEILEITIIYLIIEYENNYEELKKDLEIPIGSEFSFSFEYDDGTVIAPKEILQIPSINIYATEFLIQYIDKNSNTLLGTLRIKVW